jgi:2'-deoxymugineic-acid 2'-dioxygenase/mugineic-acid 3-dioxygenase
MENMLHLAPSQALPLDRCIFSSEHQLPQAISAAASQLPVIDMSRGRSEVRRAILEAGMEFGFFMVTMMMSNAILSTY